MPFSPAWISCPFRRRFPALLLCLANFAARCSLALQNWSTAPALPPCFACWRSRQCCPCGVIAVYPMQTVFRFSRCGARFGNKNRHTTTSNLTIPSGIALVLGLLCSDKRAKTCSGSFGRRTEILNVYVILNCWNTLPQKSNCVNKSFESTPLSAACKKNEGNFGKREGLDRASPLDIRKKHKKKTV